MLLSVIIVSHNTRKLLSGCIASIFAAGDPHACEVIVVDNDSSDGSCEMLQDDHRQVQCIRLNQNAGFAKANNIGYRASRGQVLVFLNSDTVVRAGALGRIGEFLVHQPDVGVVGPKICDGQGRPTASYQRYMDACKLFLGSQRLKRLLDIERYRMNYPTYRFNAMQQVDWVSGACLAIRRDVFAQVGCWDENYFLYYEDMDLCLQVAKRGLKIVYYPDAEITHLFGGSAMPSAELGKIRRKSLRYYFRKNHSKTAYSLIALYTLVTRLQGK